VEEPEPPHKLEYHRHSSEADAKLDIGLFFAGLIIGTTASGLIWWLGRRPFVMNLSEKAILIVLTTKVTIAIATIVVERTRGFGLGLLVSIAIGGLIFFGVCASMP